MDMNYVEEVKFSRYFSNLVTIDKPKLGSDAVFKAYNIGSDARIQYNDQMDFERIAHKFGIFEKWKDGIPRMAYEGVVVFRFQGRFFYLEKTLSGNFESNRQDTPTAVNSWLTAFGG